MAVKLTDCDCSGSRDVDEAACVLGVNNQHPSEVMGTMMEEGQKGGPACVCVVGGGAAGR